MPLPPFGGEGVNWLLIWRFFLLRNLKSSLAMGSTRFWDSVFFQPMKLRFIATIKQALSEFLDKNLSGSFQRPLLCGLLCREAFSKSRQR